MAWRFLPSQWLLRIKNDASKEVPLQVRSWSVCSKKHSYLFQTAHPRLLTENRRLGPVGICRGFNRTRASFRNQGGQAAEIAF